MFALLLSAAVAATPPAQDAPTAIANGLTWMDEYGANWMESRKCSSCHHLAQTVWVLTEAKAAGYKIDDKFLTEVSGFLTAADNRAKIFLAPDEKRPEILSQLSGGAVYGLFALAAIEKPSKEVREFQAKAVKHILEKQDKDGVWSMGLRPPISGDKPAATALVALSLMNSKLEGDQAAAAKAAWEKGSKHVHAVKDDGAELQLPVLKLWLEAKAGDAAAAKASMESILARQNKDGGWGQLKDAPSDAWATGQTLYVLSVAGRKSDDPAMQKARDWLVKNQLKDGSWLIKSRPFGPENKVAKNVEPITYAATSWALLGLIRTTPKK